MGDISPMTEMIIDCYHLISLIILLIKNAEIAARWYSGRHLKCLSAAMC